MRSHLPHKKDANQNELVAVFLDLHCSVLDLSMVGNDCPDILVSTSAATALVEIKSGSGKLTPGQERFKRDWRGACFSARTAEDCIAIVQKLNLHHSGPW